MFIIGISPLVLVAFGIALIIEHCSGKKMSFEELCITTFGAGSVLVLLSACILGCL